MTGSAAGKLGWEQLSDPLRHEIQQRLQAQVAESVTPRGGFTSGFAARLRLVGGRGVFCKGIPACHGLAAVYRTEASAGTALPTDAPAPRLLFSGEHAGWIVLAFDDVGGRSADQAVDGGPRRPRDAPG